MKKVFLASLFAMQLAATASFATVAINTNDDIAAQRVQQSLTTNAHNPWYLGDPSTMALATVVGKAKDAQTTVHEKLDTLISSSGGSGVSGVQTTVTSIQTTVQMMQVSQQVDDILNSMLNSNFILNNTTAVFSKAANDTPSYLTSAGSNPATLKAGSRFLSLFNTGNGAYIDLQLMTNGDKLTRVLRALFGISDTTMATYTSGIDDAGIILTKVLDNVLGTSRNNQNASSQTINWTWGQGGSNTGNGINKFVIGSNVYSVLNTLAGSLSIPTNYSGDPVRLKLILTELLRQS